MGGGGGGFWDLGTSPPDIYRRILANLIRILSRDASRSFKMLPNASGCFRMLQDAPRCFIDASRFFKILQRCSQMLHRGFKILQDPSKMLWEASGCFRILQRCSRILPDALGYSQMLQDASGSFKDAPGCFIDAAGCCERMDRDRRMPTARLIRMKSNPIQNNPDEFKSRSNMN